MSAPMVFGVRTIYRSSLRIAASKSSHILCRQPSFIQTHTRLYSSSNKFSLRRSRYILSGALGLTVAASLARYLSIEKVEADDGGKPPSLVPSKVVKSETDNTGLKLTLYQYQTCPFCCKVRAYLDYYGFNYNIVEVNSVWRQQIKWSKYRKVPILVCDGIGENGYLQLNDSSVVISLLDSFLEDNTSSVEKLQSFYPSIESTNEKGKKMIEFPNKYFIMYENKEVKSSTPDQRKEEREWRKWTDSHLVHMISPNVYRTPHEAIQAFRYFSDAGEWEKHFSSLERYMVIYIGATAMYFLGKMLKKKYKLKEDVRESLYDHCREWTSAIGKSREFMGGDRPNLADLSVYGSLSSFEGCDAFGEMVYNTDIGSWYFKMKNLVSTSAGAGLMKMK